MQGSGRNNYIRHERLTVVFLATILLVAALGVVLAYRYYYNGITSVTKTSSSVSSLDQVLSTSDYNSSLGLLLTLSISNSTIPQDDGISFHIALNNTLAAQNTLTPPPENYSTWQPSWNLMPCTTYSIGVQIFQGNFVPGNLSQGSALDLIVPGGFPGCADHPRASISFAPLSGNITSPVGWWINQSAASNEYWGSWGGVTPPAFQNAEFSSFQPGIYTVEGMDWWGQVTLLHFQVVTNENPLDCATIASNLSFVEGANFSASAGPLKLEGYYQDLQSNNTVVLELTTKGNSTLALGNPYTNDIHYGVGPFVFSPNSTLRPQTWQYHSPDGIVSDPTVVFPNECSLVSVTFESSYAGVPLLYDIGNQTQTFTLNQ